MFMFGLRNRPLLAVHVLLAIREGLRSSFRNQDVLFTISKNILTLILAIYYWLWKEKKTVYPQGPFSSCSGIT